MKSRHGEDDNRRRGKEDRDEGEGDGITLRVGCLCWHRSVAFSEQLAMVQWMGDWTLGLRHCDLTPEVKRRERRKQDVYYVRKVHTDEIVSTYLPSDDPSLRRTSYLE